MEDRMIRSGMITWDDNYFIVEVMTIGWGEWYVVKTCIDKKWEQRRFNKPNRVISYYRSLTKKADLAKVGSLAQNLYKVLNDHLLSELTSVSSCSQSNAEYTQPYSHHGDM